MTKGQHLVSRNQRCPGIINWDFHDDGANVNGYAWQLIKITAGLEQSEP